MRTEARALALRARKVTAVSASMGPHDLLDKASGDFDLVRAALIDWMNRWVPAQRALAARDEYCQAALGMTAAVTPAILQPIAARASIKLANPNEDGGPADLRKISERVGDEGYRWLEDPFGWKATNRTGFYTRLGLAGGRHLSKKLRGGGHRLPVLIDMEESDSPSATIAAIIEALLVLVDVHMGRCRPVPKKGSVLALSPVWWKAPEGKRYPGFLWLTSDHRLEFRGGHGFLGTVIFWISKAGFESIQWDGRCGTVVVNDHRYELDFVSTESNGLTEGVYLGSPASEWAQGLDSFYPGLGSIVLVGDCLAQAARGRAQKDPTPIIEYWKKALALN
jgi:hypothetical protein